MVFRHFNHIRDQVVAFRMGQGDIHTEASHQTDDALWYRERFAIRRGPCHGDFFTFQFSSEPKCSRNHASRH